MQGGRLALDELPRAEHPHDDPVGVGVEGGGQQHDGAEEENRDAVATGFPAGRAEKQGADHQQGPQLEQVAEDEAPSSKAGPSKAGSS